MVQQIRMLFFISFCIKNYINLYDFIRYKKRLHCNLLNRYLSFMYEYIHQVAGVFALALLTGCAAQPVVQLQQVKVPVPVVCQEPIPERPAMPTEALQPPVGLDAFAQAAMAEIERREGYEQQLLAGLRACAASWLKR